jgi:hypothetical protein
LRFSILRRIRIALVEGAEKIVLADESVLNSWTACDVEVDEEDAAEFLNFKC